MKAIDVRCPVCGTVNTHLYLEETDGWMECTACGCTVHLLEIRNQDATDVKNCRWQIIRELPFGKKAAARK